MKITQVKIDQKGKEELYNDGNRKFENIRQTQEIEHVDFSKEDGYYFNIKPSTQQEINKSLTNIHEFKESKGIKDNDGKETFVETKVSKDYPIKDATKEPINISNDGKVSYGNFKVSIPKNFNNHTNNVVDKKGEIIGFQEGTDQDINTDYLIDAKNVSEKKGIITSKIDGQIDWTNVQDTNISGDPNKSFGENAADFGTSVGKQATGSLGNALGFSNSDLNDTIGAFKNVGLGNDEISAFDKDMNKLNTWKHDKFKEFHVFDWKPGQTIPPDLMGGDLANMVKDAGNMPFIPKESRDKFNKGFNKVKEIISPDPIKVVREAIKPTKGIFDSPTVKAEEISIQDDLTGGTYDKSDKSDTVSFNWVKNPQLWNGFNKSEKEIRVINALKNKNTFNKTLGSLYIRPNAIYNEDSKVDEGGVKNLEIPFEFNPDISEGATQANYATETLMNRIGQFNIYTGTNLPTVSINLSYVALAPDELDEEDSSKISKQYSTDSWQYYWTNNRIEQIEYKLRSLVMPDVTSADYLIKPPLIEIHLGNPNGEGADSVGDLFKYPIGIYNGNEVKSDYLGDQERYLATSRTIDGSDGTINRYKKYIVTSVQISNFNDDSFMWPSLYGRVWQNGKSGNPINHIKTAGDLKMENGSVGFNGYTRRTGFKATLQCVEVVENFLDIVPDFKAYYNAWSFKGAKADQVAKYVKIMTNEKIQETTDYLSNSINSVVADIATIDARLNAAFSEAYMVACLYKQARKRFSRLSAFNNQSLMDNSDDVNGNYYFANPEWFKIKDDSKPKEESGSEEESPEEEKKNPKETKKVLERPVYFKVELPKILEKFLDKLDKKLNWNDNINDQMTEMRKPIEFFNIEKEDLGKILKPYEKNYSSKNVYAVDGEPEKIGTKNLVDLDYLCLIDDSKEEYYGDDIITISLEDKETETYTDKECLALISYIFKLSDDYYHKIISNIDENMKYPLEIDRQDDSDNMLKFIILNALGGDTSGLPEPKDIYEPLLTMGKPLRILYDNIKKFVKKYNTEISAKTTETANKIFEYYERKDKGEEGVEITQRIYKNADIKLVSEQIFSVVEYNDIVNGSTSFEEFRTELFGDIEGQIKEDDVMTSSQVHSAFKGLNEVLNNYYEALLSIRVVSVDIIDNSFMDKDALKEVANSVSLAMISDKSRLKGLNSKVVKVNCKVRNELGKNVELCDKNYGEEKKSKSTEERDPFEMDCIFADNLSGMKFISISYIVDKMIDSYKDSQKQIGKLEKELERFKINENKYKQTFKDVKDIKFDNLENLLKDVKDTEDATIICSEYLGLLQINNYLPMVSYSSRLKNTLYNHGIQDQFTKIVGYDEETKEFVVADNPEASVIPVIEGLEPLRKKYKEYSQNEGSLRELVFKEAYDNRLGTSELTELLNSFETDEYGKIPNLYYNINKARELQRTMQVAGSSINHFEKLSGSSAKES